MTKTLFVVSANLPDGLPTDDPNSPRKDYAIIGRRLQADILEWSAARATPRLRLLCKLIGIARVQAWLAFQRRGQYDVILTDGEHIGIVLALLLKLARASVRHITIGHRISARKKRPFFRLLGVQSHLHTVILHSRYQYELAIERLGFKEEQLALFPYQVDTDFWHPMSAPEQRLIVSAGLEFRDYPTLFKAVDGLDVQVIVAAASHWSRRRNTALGVHRPENVTVSSLNYQELRELFARAAIVAVPVDDVDFQAGITTILEAMAMGKVVVATHTYGQTDVIEDRRSATRAGEGTGERSRPMSLLRNVADEAEVMIEPNGFYVPPHDPGALQRAIVYLLEHPEDREQLGAAGRRAVERLMTVDQFAERIAQVVERIAGQQNRTSAGLSGDAATSAEASMSQRSAS